MLRDIVRRFSSEDVEMEAAIWKAKQTFGQFLEAFLKPQQGQTAFLVKVAFVDDDQGEHVWVADLDFSGERIKGVVANEPKLRNLRFMGAVEFEPAQITDWMYVQDGYLVGGYTTRLICKRMSPKERAAFDAATPYKF
jgi:uncharacterized protein YegJ (DUF2314 family)